MNKVHEIVSQSDFFPPVTVNATFIHVHFHNRDTSYYNCLNLDDDGCCVTIQINKRQ